MATQQQTRLDPVTFSILSSAFVNLVDEMVSTVRRSCLSFAIFNGDFSGGMMDTEGKLVAQGTRDVSVHVGTLEPSTKSIIEDFPTERMNPGDSLASRATGSTSAATRRAPWTPSPPRSTRRGRTSPR